MDRSNRGDDARAISDVETTIECRPIGVVRTPFETLEDAPRQGIESNARGAVVLDDQYAPGLEGLAAGDRVDVVWFADRADGETLRVRDGTRGVFATRSPMRPNPIGISPCRIERVDPPRVVVRGVDALDGTPVLDLKVGLE